MSDWQPGIIWPVHTRDLDGAQKERALSLRGKRVRIKEVPEMTNRAPDCDPASRAFLVHPDDVKTVAPWHADTNAAICEHEILTD